MISKLIVIICFVFALIYLYKNLTSNSKKSCNSCDSNKSDTLS